MPQEGKSKFLSDVRDKLRYKHYSYRTEQAYIGWIRRFILFHGKRHPTEMGGEEVTAFLSHLAVHGGVASATQNQALCALLFMYREVLGQELPWLSNIEYAKKPKRLPVVLTQQETARLLDRLEGTLALMARLQYGSGMRLMECLRLRVKDVCFERREILIRDGKGGKDRVTMLPETLAQPLKEHLARVRSLYESDRKRNLPGVQMPDALERKYPNGAGNGCSPRALCLLIRVAASNADIMLMRRLYSVRSSGQGMQRALPSL